MIPTLRKKIPSCFSRIMLVGLMSSLLWAVAAQAEQTNATVMKPVVVTGSLIPTAETSTATPVDIIPIEEIEKVGAQSVYQLVRTLPSAYGPGNFGDSRGNGGNGTAGIGLRGLARGTLVLVNGRRVAPENHGIATGNVDL